MNLWRVLLAKDLRRIRRNPWPWLIHLAVPLSITALLGLAFGSGGGEGGGLGRIRFALVDEDQSPLTQMLRDLRDVGFRGYLSLELFNRELWKADALAVARMGLDKMRAVVRSSLE